MSDEDRDIDIESDDDLDTNESYGRIRNGSFGSGSISGGLQSGNRSDMMSPLDGPFTEDKRAHHNALERKRRDHIKDSFSSLRECIPSLNGEKASRAQILKKATEYIQFMRKKNSSHQHDIEDLKRQNTQLEAQIRALEKAKATGQFASVTALLTQSNHSDNSSSDMDSDNSVFKRKRLRTALTE